MEDSNNYEIEVEDGEDDVVEDIIDLDEDTFEELRKNNPAITYLGIQLNTGNEYYFNNIDWKENGDCISNNKHLRKLLLSHRTDYEDDYILGEEGNELPTRQQLKDFFSCIYRNSSVDQITIHNIQVVDEFGSGLIEGLCGHPSLARLELGQGRIGNIAYSALGKVLNQSSSKLKDLCIRRGHLGDAGLSILCDGLLGNNTMKKLDLSGNDITSAGWRALSTVLQHPNCNLIELGLHNAGISDEESKVLRTTIISSSLKALGLGYNPCISRTGWQTFLNHLSQTSVVKLNLENNMIDHAALAVLANIGSLQSLDLSYSRLIAPTGWQTFFDTLQSRRAQLKKLRIKHNIIGNEGIQALGSLLSNMRTLKSLAMSCISDPHGTNNVTSHGWQSFFTTLQDCNLNLVKLDLEDNNFGDVVMAPLTRAVSNMNLLKRLNLSHNRSVSPICWQILRYLQSPNFALEILDLSRNKIDDNTLVVFTILLAHNKTLKWLHLEDCFGDDGVLITERGWEAVSTLLCNKSSIINTYDSNHTLQNIGFYFSDEIRDLWPHLELNRNEDKVEVARQKILQAHFSSEDDTSNMQELLDMELKVMPTAISWIGRPAHVGWSGTNVSELSALFNLMRRLPDLFDSSAQKTGGAKRKRNNSYEH